MAFVGVVAGVQSGSSRDVAMCVLARPQIGQFLQEEHLHRGNRDGIHRLKWFDDRNPSVDGKRVVIEQSQQAKIKNPLRSVKAMRAIAEYEKFLYSLSPVEKMTIRDFTLFYAQNGGLACSLQSEFDPADME